jgi:hypothetical protein
MSLFAFVTSAQQADEGIPQFYTPLVGKNLFSQGLVFAQVYTGCGGRSIQELVAAYKGTIVSSVNWRGPQMDTTGASGVPVNYSTGAFTADMALGAFSCFARVKQVTSVATGGIAERNDGNTVNAGWQIGCNNTGTKLEFVRATTDYSAKTNAALTVGRWTTVGIAYPGDLTASNCKIYYDGVVQTINSATNGSGAQGSDLTRDMCVGSSNFGADAGPFNGYIDCIYFWKRYLRQEEFMMLTANPYLPVTSMAYRPSAPFTTTFNPVVASSFPGLFFAI